MFLMQVTSVTCSVGHLGYSALRSAANTRRVLGDKQVTYVILQIQRVTRSAKPKAACRFTA
jgi:hypothetical protein